MEDRIKELEQLIPYYAEKYYAGETIISDSEFDKLTEELEQLNPNSSILNRVGWGSEENSKGKVKLEHIYTEVGSLKKTREFEGLPNLFLNTKINISPKLDGLTMVCYYKDGKLDKAITRGNGTIGIDKTDKMRAILSKKNINLPDDFTGAVRGEILIPQKNWEIIKATNNDANNSRNYAAGLINRDDISKDLQYVDFVTYKILGDTGRRFITKSGIVKFLKDCGFDTIWNIQYTISNKEEWLKKSYEMYTDDYDYQLDGLVLSQEEINYNDKDGIEYQEFAWKFESEQKWAKVTGITYTLSRNQRLIPVVNIEPTEILETIVQNVTANNAKWLLDRNIDVGKEVLVEKGGEIIPKIVDVR